MSESSGDDLVDRSVRIVLRPVGNPLPLGFLALGTATVLVSGLQLRWLGANDSGDVALVLIAFVAPVQLLASVFGFLGRDVVAGTGMGVLAGTWLSVGLVMRAGPPGATNDAMGLLLLVAAIAMLVPAITATGGKLVAAAVLFTTSVRFAATGVFELTAGNGWREVAGVVGVVLGALAAYAALAMALEDAGHRTVLPVLRRGSGRTSLEGGLHDQLDRIEREAGVREQL